MSYLPISLCLEHSKFLEKKATFVITDEYSEITEYAYLCIRDSIYNLQKFNESLQHNFQDNNNKFKMTLSEPYQNSAKNLIWTFTITWNYTPLDSVSLSELERACAFMLERFYKDLVEIITKDYNKISTLLKIRKTNDNANT